MKKSLYTEKLLQRSGKRLLAVLLLLGLGLSAIDNVEAHPLGNFTINHFTRIEVWERQLRLRYVIDMAEIPTLQELQANGAFKDVAELERYANSKANAYSLNLRLVLDQAQLPLQLTASRAKLLDGAAGLNTLRIECDFLANYDLDPGLVHRVQFNDENYSERIGWREIVVVRGSDVSVFDSSAYGTPATDELKSYPAESLSAPLEERSAQFSFTTGVVPNGSRTLVNRDGKPATPATRDRLADLIRLDNPTSGVALAGLLVAMLLGGLHAMSPGHGKAIVGAYLIGSRGTARHAALLGLIVTVTHTFGVFALGSVTLLASEFVVPERIYPVLSLLSGAMVVLIGLSLVIRRVQEFISSDGTDEEHTHGHDHLSVLAADGSPVVPGLKALVALGVSGGLLPCPSALVVLLAAISLHRVGYGLLLVVAFSIGLAGMLTLVGLAVVYARRFLSKRASAEASGRLIRLLPLISAAVITCAGAAISFAALQQAGVIDSHTFENIKSIQVSSLISAGAFGVLGLGLLFGLKHATEADHIVAVSAIVSEHRKLTRAALVGGLWGAGHTLSLLVVGAFVLVLKVTVPNVVAGWLEFGVALMIILLGTLAMRRALRARSDFHAHTHSHGSLQHTHIHFHEAQTGHSQATPFHTHALRQVGLKPLIVGAMHGLAGSATLTLLVLTQIKSVILGFLYLSVFGIGSIFGMLLMSGLIGLPFVVSSRRVSGIHHNLQLLAGALSIVFGFWYAYQTGFGNG